MESTPDGHMVVETPWPQWYKCSSGQTTDVAISRENAMVKYTLHTLHKSNTHRRDVSSGKEASRER